MTKVYSWVISETKYGYIINPNDVNKDVLNNEASALITTEKLIGSNLELIKQWTANCTDDEYVIQFDRLKELCKSNNIKVNFENVSNYLNINSDCDNLTGPQGKEGRGILRIESDYTDVTKNISYYDVIYTDGKRDKIEVRNGADGKKGAKGDTPHTQVNLFIYKTGGEDYMAPKHPIGGSYNFNTNEFTQPEGWVSINDIPGPIYMSTGLAKSNEINDKGIVSNIVWSTPSLISGKDGKAGADGDSIEFIYKSSKSPNDNIEAPIISENINDFIPEGWSDSPQGVDETNKVEWMCQRKIDKSTGKWGDWSTPVIWSKWGENGMDGDGIEYIYLLTEKGTPPKNPTPDDWEDNPDYQDKDSEWLPNPQYDENLGIFVEWTDEPSGVKSDIPFEWVSSRKYDGVNKSWGAFSEPKLWAKFGEQGKSGIVTRTLYRKKINSSTNDIPDLPTENNYGQWVGVFPEYDISKDVVWSTECEIYANDNSIVYRYRLISSRDDNGDVIYPRGDLSVYEYKEVDVIPIEKDANDYNYLLLTNGDLYEWGGGWSTPSIVSGIKGEEGIGGNTYLPIYCYNEVGVYPPNKKLIGFNYNNFNATEGYNSEGFIWYSLPYSDVGVDNSKKRWYKCTCLVNGYDNKVIKCSDVEYAFAYDGVSNATIVIFKSGEKTNTDGTISYEVPKTPKGGSYDFNQMKLTEPEGWKDNQSGLLSPVYSSYGTVSSESPNKIKWGEPIRITGDDGKVGADGTSTEFIYKLSKEKPNTPNSVQGNDNIPDGWKDSPQGITKTNTTEWMCQRKKDKTTGIWGDWTEPVIWSKWGEDGVDGNGVEYIYTTTSTNEAPNNPTPDDWEDNPDYQDKDSEWLPGENGEIKDGSGNILYTWADEPSGVTKEKPFEWVSSRKYDGANKSWGEFTDPALWAKFVENVEMLETRYKIVTDSTNSNNTPYVNTKNYANPDEGNPNTQEKWEKSVGTINTNDVLWQIQTRSIKKNDGTWDFVDKNETWHGPTRLTGNQGEVGAQGIPGIGYQICYCLGTKNTYFGVNPIGNEENNLYENQYRWFKSESMPDSDFIEIEYKGYNQISADIKNKLKETTDGILKNTGRVIKIIYNKNKQDESYDYLLINGSTYSIEGIKHNQVIKLGETSENISGLNSNLIYQDVVLNKLSKSEFENGIWVWATQGEVKYEGNEPKGVNWCKPFTIQGSAGVNGVRGRAIYPAGNYNSTKIYETTPDSAPYVYDTLGESFYLLNKEMKWLGEYPDNFNELPEDEKEKYKDIPLQDKTPWESINGGNSPWIEFENLQALYASVAVINMGTIGASVYAGDFMFSQFGKVGGKNTTDDNFGIYISTLSGGAQAKFLDGYTVDANGNYKDNGKIIESYKINPYEKNADETWKHSFRPATCINFKTGKMWVDYGKVSFGGYTKDGENYTGESVNGLGVENIEHLKNSFSEDSTEISGGLALTNFIGLKDGNEDDSSITAFINGSTTDNGLGKQLKDSVFAAGIETSNEDGEKLSITDDRTSATINLTRDGINSKIGVFRVYEDGIGVDAGNNKNILITNKSIDDESIKSISAKLENKDGLYVSDYIFEGEFVNKETYNPKATTNYEYYQWIDNKYTELPWTPSDTTDDNTFEILDKIPTSILDNVKYLKKKNKNKLKINLLEGDELTEGGLYIGRYNYLILPTLIQSENGDYTTSGPRFNGYDKENKTNYDTSLLNRYQVRDYDISLGTTEVLNTRGKFYLNVGSDEENKKISFKISLLLNGFGKETGAGSVYREVRTKISNVYILAKLIRCDKNGNEVNFKPKKIYNYNDEEIREIKENPFHYNKRANKIFKYKSKRDNEIRYYEALDSDDSKKSIYRGFDKIYDIHSNAQTEITRELINDTDGKNLLIDGRYRIMQKFDYKDDIDTSSDTVAKRSILTLDFCRGTHGFDSNGDETEKTLENNIKFSEIFELDEDSYYRFEFILHFRVRSIYQHGANPAGNYNITTTQDKDFVTFTIEDLIKSLQEPFYGNTHINIDSNYASWNKDTKKYDIESKDETKPYVKVTYSEVITNINYILCHPSSFEASERIKINNSYYEFSASSITDKESYITEYKKIANHVLTVELLNGVKADDVTARQQGDFLVIGKDGIKNYYTHKDIVDKERFKLKFSNHNDDAQKTLLYLKDLPTSNPNNIGQIWDNNGVLNISDGTTNN